MAACLSPVNLSAPMSSFFLRPAERQFQPFQQERLAAAISTAMRQPRGPPAPKTPVLGAPAPILMASAAPVVMVAAAPKKSWRDRVAAAAAEVKEAEQWKEVPAKKSPKSPKSFKTPKSPKSPKRKGTKAARTASPEPTVVVEVAAPVEPESPKARVYDITYLLCLSTSPLVSVSEIERAHMENLVYNYTWRRGPHQSLSRPSSRASSRSSSPTPSSRSSSPAPVAAPMQRLRSEHRRTSSKLRNFASSDEE